MKIVSDYYTTIDQKKDLYIDRQKVRSWRFVYNLWGMRISIEYDYTVKKKKEPLFEGKSHLRFKNFTEFVTFLSEYDGGHILFTYFMSDVNNVEQKLRRGSEWS